MTGAAALVPLRDVDPGLEAAWRALAARALEPNPFAAPELALAAARSLPGAEGDELLVVRRGGELVFALPVRRAARHRRLPVTTYRACGHEQAFLDTPLVDAVDPVGAWSAALGALGGGWLALERSGADGPVRRALDEALARRGARMSVLGAGSRPMVRRRPDPEAADAGLSAQRRKTLRKARRRLEAELGAPLVLREAAATDLGGAVRRFLELERQGWKGRAGTALASTPGGPAFLEEALGAHRARAQVWELAAGPRVVAALCAVVDGGTAFHLKVAHDEAVARHSPGLQLELAVLAAFLEADPALNALDSCADGTDPDSPSALLYPDRRPMASVLVSLKPPARVAATALVSYRRLRTAVAGAEGGGRG